MDESKQYSNKIVYLGFVMSIFIILRHGVNIDTYSLDSSTILYWIENWVREFTDLMVPTFFGLSGFLFYQNFNNNSLFKKWKSRFFSLVIPYLFWNVFAFLCFSIIYSFPFVSQNVNQSLEPFTLISLLRNAIMGEHNITWFLRYLIIYTLVCPALYKILNKKTLGALLVVLVFIISLFVRHRFLISGVFYLFGSWLGCNFSHVVKKKHAFIYVSAIYILVSTIICLFVSSRLYIILYVPLRLTQCVAIWLFADIFYIKDNPKWWMRISFFVYCSHSPILESVEKIIFILLGNNLTGAIVDFIFATPITFLIIVCFAWLLKKVPIVWNVASGNR